MTSRPRLLALLPLLLLPLAQCTTGNGQEDPPGEPEVPPTPVTLGVATLGSAARTVSATGRVEPFRIIEVSSRIGGAVLEVRVEEGDRVRVGTLLARLDTRELEAQAVSARAALDVAQRTADRSRELIDKQIITVAEFERDQAALAAAQATWEQLQARREYATVRAPVGGVVLRKSVEVGAVVAPQSDLFTIGDDTPLVVRVPVSELDVTALRAGDSVAVALDAVPGRVLSGRIRRIFPAADSATRLVPVEVELVGAAAHEARPGFLARVAFRLAPREGLLLVPAAALVEGPSGSAVFVVAAGRAARRRVERGESFGGRVQIRDGLVPGDTVVVVGASLLRDGAAVRPSALPDARGTDTLEVGR